MVLAADTTVAAFATALAADVLVCLTVGLMLRCSDVLPDRLPDRWPDVLVCLTVGLIFQWWRRALILVMDVFHDIAQSMPQREPRVGSPLECSPCLNDMCGNVGMHAILLVCSRALRASGSRNSNESLLLCMAGK